jgi:RES domain-containing protein
MARALFVANADPFVLLIMLERPRIGDAWVMSAASLLLEVPSAVIPFEQNYLLNPAHPAMGSLHIGKPQAFSFDPRLLGPA